jgi:tRNA (mo5U34)-methyltransferase
MTSLSERVAKYHWHHSIDLGGVVTPGDKSPELHRLESSAFFDCIRLDGSSVIDIGAWNGFYSFDAKRRGAERVVACDSYCWTHERYRGLETFELARGALGLDVEALQVDLLELSPGSHGVFDVVLLAGVLYHLQNPERGLEIAASLASEVLIVESQTDLNFIDRPSASYRDGKWWPNIPCVFSMLKKLGFAHIDMSQVSHNRAIFHAWRSDSRRLSAPKSLVSDLTKKAKLRAARRLAFEALGLMRSPAP